MIKIATKKSAAHYAKGIVAALGAAVVTITAVATDGINHQEWVYVVTSILAAAGVVGVPNKPAGARHDNSLV